VDHKFLEGSKRWCRKRIEKINWTDRVKNEDIYELKRRGTSYKQQREGKPTGLVSSCVETDF
jgi:hypothetical protein